MFTNIEEQRKADVARIRAEWESFETELAKKTDPETSARITGKLKEMYSIFSSQIIDFYASLYDPQTSAFYYSKSAQSTDGYLPDLESTAQILGYLRQSNVLYPFGDANERGIFRKVLPARICDGIVEWTRSLQCEENGFFYHPQWTKEATDANLSRRGRDLSNANNILNMLGGVPLYDTPDGVKGEVGSSAVKEEKKAREISAHLVSDATFKAYLESLPVKTNSYSVGNTLESQSEELVERDKELAAGGANYSLCRILREFFEERQDPVTGLWQEGNEVTYIGVNGILKIGRGLDRCNEPIPNPMACLRTVKQAISMTSPEHMCCVLNPWYAISTLTDNVNRFATCDKEMLAEFNASLASEFPELIDVTISNLLKFRKSDGSYSFYPTHSSEVSQKMPVAVPDTNEGDVNATLCARATMMHITNILRRIYGVKAPSRHMVSDLMRFSNTIESMS